MDLIMRWADGDVEHWCVDVLTRIDRDTVLVERVAGDGPRVMRHARTTGWGALVFVEQSAGPTLEMIARDHAAITGRAEGVSGGGSPCKATSLFADSGQKKSGL